MDKFSFSKSSVDLDYNNFVKFTTTILILLITFNLGWLVMLLRLYTRFNIVKNLNKILFNFDSFLLLGNLSILILFIIYALSIRSIKDILGRK